MKEKFHVSIKKYILQPNHSFKLKKISFNDTGDFSDDEEGKQAAEVETGKILSKLDELQQLLYADASRALLIVLQAMDTGGKDGTIKNVMRNVNPQGCKVASFKVPTPLELSHDFLWRVHQEIPPKGYIGIFNRSHYEDVLVPRVHGTISKKVQKQRFDQINDFERMLSQNGVTLLKFFLHISKEEQRQRLLARARDPQKHWKFNINDIHERKYWDDYQRNFEQIFSATSTKFAPWIVVPANHKWYRNLVVGKFVVKTLKEMDLKFPPPPPGLNLKKLKIPR